MENNASSPVSSVQCEHGNGLDCKDCYAERHPQIPELASSDKFLEALKELLREKSITLSEAVRMYRTEKGCGLLDVKRCGALAILEEASR